MGLRDSRRCATRLAGAFVLSLLFAFLPPGSGGTAVGQQASANGHFVFVVDRSDSMSGARIAHTRQAAQLGVEILGDSGRVTVIGFSDAAEASAAFDLATQSGQARRCIEAITPGGGTQYVPALEAIPPDATAVLFLSDGRPAESEQAILDAVRPHVHCPVHTIGVQASPDAEHLLGAIAASTSGGFYRVGKPSEVVEAFLKVLGQVRRFARHDFLGESLALDDVEGELLVLGVDTKPELLGAGSVSRFETALADSTVHLARASLQAPANVQVKQSGGPERKVIVIRFDLPQPSVQLRRVAGVGPLLVEAVATFRDRHGRTVSPADARITSSFELLDPEGAVVRKVVAQPRAGEPGLSALVELPPEADKRPYVVRHVAVYPSQGAPFVVAESRAVRADTLPAAPALRPATTVTATAGRPGEPLECVVQVAVDGRFERLNREFCEELRDNPPLLQIIRPDGDRADAGSQPGQFTSEATVSGDGKAVVCRLVYRGADVPGAYRVTVVEGQAAGVPYPGASRDVYCVDPGEIQVVGVTRRRRQRCVLFDSQQQLTRYALVGDAFWMELVRGHMDPRKFAGLAGGLKARLVGADGAVTTVALHFRDNRYVTDEVTLARPGLLRIEVDIAVEGLRTHFEGQLRIGSVQLSIEPVGQLLLDAMQRLPQGALVPFDVGVRGTVFESPAPWEDVLEVIQRQQLRLSWTLRDSAGVPIQQQTASSPQAWKSRIWLSQTGKHTCVFALMDSTGRSRASLGWELDVVESPVQCGLMHNGPGGALEAARGTDAAVAWVPRWLTTTPDCVLVAKAAPSDFATRYYLSGVRVDDAEVPFDQKRGCYVVPVCQSGSVELIGKLSPYDFGSAPAGLAEIQVLQRRQLEIPRSVRWGMLMLVATAAAVGSGLSLRVGQGLLKRWHLKRLSRKGWEIVIYGPHTDARRLVRRDQRRWTPRLQVCKPNDDPSSLFLAYPDEAQDCEVLGAATQRLNGKVRFQAFQQLPQMTAGESRDLEQVGDTVELDARNTLTLEAARRESK